MPIKPGPGANGESQSDWMARCVPEMAQSDSGRTNDQNVAACAQMWRDRNKSAKPRRRRQLKLDLARLKARWPQVQAGLLARIQKYDVPEPEDDDTYSSFLDWCMQDLVDEGVDEGEAEVSCDMAWNEANPEGEQESLASPQVVHKQKRAEGTGMEFILSDETPDRMGDIVMSDGWDTANFERNPVALFGHNSSFPVGTWTNISVKDKALRGHLVLAPKGISARIDEIRGLVEAGVLRAVSVGFRPRESRPLPGDSGGFAFTKNELVEVSLVSIPANPNALAVAKSLHVSPETQKLVFAEHGSEKTGRALILSEPRAQPGAKRDRPTTGKHADPSRKGRTPMPAVLLSKRVEDAEKFLVSLQDQLTEHLEKVDDTNVTDDDMAITEDLNVKIDAAMRNRDNLVAAEKRLARTVEKRQDLVQASAFTPATPAVQGQQRPFMLPAKKINPLDYLVRQGIVQAFSHTRKINLVDAQRLAGYGDDEITRAFIDYSMRAATAPALTTVTGWAAELIQTVYGAFLDLLSPASVMPQLASRGLSLSFGRAGRVILPTRNATPSLAGSFIGEGAPIPVRQGQFKTVTMLPKKLGVITSWTREMDERSVPAIEGVLRDAVTNDTGVAIDNILLDATAATAIRPPGLRSASAGLTPTAGGGFNALVGDIKQLTGALLSATAGHIRSGVFLMNPQQVLSISLTQAPSMGGFFPFAEEVANDQLRGFGIIESGNVPLGTVIFLDAADFVVVGEEAPRFEVSDQATLHFEDTNPLDIVSGSPGTAASPSKNMFQTDSLALRLIWPLNWELRRTGMVSWVAGVTW